MAVLTVSQINRYMASKIREDSNLQRFMIKGEISNFTAHRSGHFYFTLKDSESVIKAVMFRAMASRLRFMPENGMHVIVSAGLTVYERDGVYQLNVTDMQPEGIGAVRLQLEQRIRKLREEGLFEESAKRPIPTNPHTVGIITSGTGAALQDMLNVLSRRCPMVQVKIFSVLVQGEQAPSSICNAIRTAQQHECDVLLLGRGGGASEDLYAFNSEQVAYAIFDCSIPVISAVGHETDVTIADAVADRRAPTPSAAAELAVPDIRHLDEKIYIAERQLRNTFAARLEREKQLLLRLKSRLQIASPQAKFQLQEEKRQKLTSRLERNMQLFLERKLSDYTAQQEKLMQLDPLKILQRGYAAVYREDRSILPSVSHLKQGDSIHIRMQDGEITAKVEKINEL
ncbi:MAG: exodeoxyribonuclease VII large subunit [Oscillospiraceae bacterium]|nr:exodeoxyribonuclease VII large subunit [Oscillospiraceae bacterium]